MKENAPEFVVGWGTLALINAGLAQTKHRSGLAWFFLSLLLGPIATFFIVVLSAVEPNAGGGRRPFNLQDFRRQ
jgi:hypothetical protein